MGGVPTLLLAIAVGITYGWQPDHEGGVEYIIQVPPNQIEQLKQTGEISSVIAPEVQGRVTRVIIRVGEGPLPRETPTALPNQASVRQAGQGANADLADAAPVPIPEMADGRIAEPIVGLPPGGLTGEQAVMKPQTNPPPGSPGTSGSGSSGPGYSFPPLPPTLQSGSGQVDQAGREVASPVGSQVNSILGPSTAGTNPPGTNPTTGGTSAIVPPPGTRSPGSTSPPPFTGSDPQGDYARVRVGGPSTDPTSPRDNSWTNFPPTTTSTSVQSANSTANGAENPFRNPAATSANVGTGASNATASSGLAPGDTYGQFPAGMSAFNAGERTSLSAGTNNYGAPPNGYAGNPATTSGYGSGGTTAMAGTAGNSSPDPRLTPVQIAAGAWSIDAYGRIYDRQGRLMSGTGIVPGSGQNGAGQIAAGQIGLGPTSAGSSTAAMNPNGNPASGLGYSGNATTIFGNQNTGGSSNLGFASNDRAWSQTQPGSSTTLGGSGFATGSGGSGYDGNSLATGSRFPTAPPLVDGTRGSESGFREIGNRDRDAVRQTSATSSIDTTEQRSDAESRRTTDPPSLSDRRYPETTVAESRREVVAPQPLFNGLLLISLVANVYLIFWLKNLRIQFRELVTAKRMASSNTP